MADAAEFLLEQIRKYPGEITLIAIGPLMNVGAAIDQGCGDVSEVEASGDHGRIGAAGLWGLWVQRAPVPPMPEWNILNDVASAQKLFASGVPLYVMPLDSTQLKLDEVKRAFLFSRGTAVTDQLAILYHLWATGDADVVRSDDAGVCVEAGVVSGDSDAYSGGREGIHARGAGDGERAGLPGFESGRFFSVLFEESGGTVRSERRDPRLSSEARDVRYSRHCEK